jgi:predicted ATPase/DNA-binding CsgD family transcriptional regulator
MSSTASPITTAGQAASVAPAPRPRAPILGRERELALAEGLLRRADVGLLTLTGAGGSGKTRLALAIAARQHGYFADGVAWVPLALVAAADQVLPAVARAIGVREIAGEELQSTLARVLSHRALLLVLDNFEHVLAAAPLICELLLRCPGLKALVTSRAPLRVSDEHELAVLPLALPPVSAHVPAVNDLAQVPSIQLWCQRVGAIDPSWTLATNNAAAVAEICRRLDGLPLAIELAAARVRMLPPDLLLERLSHRLTVLTEGPRDLPARQQTLRAAINWSYELLQPSEQRVFRRVAVFQGGFNFEAASTVGNGDHEIGVSVEDTLSALVDQHLLIRLENIAGEPRLGMLETIREFALECLAGSGETERTRRAHAEYFARLAETAEPVLNSGKRQRWLMRLDAEQANIRVALEYALEHNSADGGFRIIGSLWLWCWLTFREARRWVDELRILPGASEPSIARAMALNAAAILAWGDGDTVTARSLAEQAVALCRELGRGRELAHALQTLGASTDGDPVLMEAMYSEAAQLVHREGDPWWVALTFLRHSIALVQLGETLSARANAAEAAQRFERLADDFFLGRSRLQLGLAQLRLGELAEARRNLEASLTAIRDAHDWKYTGVALIGLGAAARAVGDASAGALAYTEALSLCREAGAAGDLPLCLEGLAAVALPLDQPAVAARLLGAAETANAAGFSPTFPGFEHAYQDTARSVADVLPPEAFAAELAGGRSLTLAEALALARGLSNIPETGERPAAPESLAPGRLSTREREVLRLVARGQSNAEIATELVLSVRTVEKHVANIYTKIGARGRADAATYALRHGFIQLPPSA